MLVQDSLGYVHEVPENQLYESDYAEYPEHFGESQVVYDGLGNPVGALPFLAAALPAIGSMFSSALPALSSALGPAARAVGSVLPQLPGAFASDAGNIARSLIPPIFQQGFPGMPGLPAPPYPGGGAPYPGGGGPPMTTMPAPYRPPWPTGWMRPQLPYTGLGPRRLYMRCAVWPGPRGLVPSYAAQLPPATAQQLANAAQQAAVAAQQAASLGLRRRRRRRR